MSSGIHKENAAFWDELCGSQLARAIGITDHSPQSLARFDQAWHDFYPYLLDFLQPKTAKGKAVLEVGTGYGTVAQALLEAGADYFAVDIAAGPLHLIRQREQLLGQPISASQASVLELPFADGTFDQVVSIGVLHHTGDVQRSLDEIYRVLRPGGIARLMLYNQFSYRQWLNWPFKTLQAWLHEKHFIARAPGVNEEQRRAYDVTVGGIPAPETAFLSIRQLRKMMAGYSNLKFEKQNASALFFIPRKFIPTFLQRLLGEKQIRMDNGFYVIPRKWLLPSLGRWLGLDIYVQASKPEVAA